MLAWNEMRRAKVRFGLLCGAVGLLVFLILFQQALLGGLVTDFIGAVDNQDAPVLVFNDQARSNVEGSFLFPDQAAAIAGVDGVASTGFIGEGTYTVETGGEIRDAVMFGYELGGLGAPSSLVEGRLPAAPGEAVSSAADRDNGFGIGDVVQIVGDGGPTIVIVGLADDLRWSVAPTMFASYDTFEAAQRAVNPQSSVVFPSLVGVQPVDGVDIGELTDRINSEVDGVEALSRQEAVDGNPGVQGVSQSFGIILGLAFLVVTLVIGFFFMILTVHKARALTLLRAVGASSRYLVKNLLVQILMVLAIGSFLGVVMTVALLRLGPSGEVSAKLDPSSVAATLLGLVVLALIGGLAAVRRVLRIDPMSATSGAGQ
ncbi:MAG: ABC transporter permease [Actinomycetia bacterium]|nr:ABC transporter permease [Actinomycetes bacterium]MCP4959467.1 ABC transporter permease [Actinomycetes bacterium]